MRNRLPLVIAATVITVAVGVAQFATAREWKRLDMEVFSLGQQLRGTMVNTFGVKPSHRASLAARQALRDQVCIAMTDDRLSDVERRLILTDAKRILAKKEYPSFQQWINQLSPPPPPPKVSVRRTVKTVRKKKEVATTLTIKEPSLKPTIPANILRAERMASMDRAR